MNIPDLDNLIRFHESMLRHQKWLMVPETIFFEEQTVKSLKELKEMKEVKQSSEPTRKQGTA